MKEKETFEMKLSICVVTMNRAEQLREALESCLACALPEKTEFVIIDNASVDHTEQVVHEVMDDCGYEFYYEKLAKNLGVGGGRNYAYGKARGDYVYMLDDDAVIDCEGQADFFLRAVKILDQNSQIVTLTTQIYDTAWKQNRVSIGKSELSEGIFKCFMFCGGSHFLRTSFYKKDPYLSNLYGYEELPPSLLAADAGKHNAVCPDLRVIHKPLIDKWNWDDSKNNNLLIREIALPYAIKRRMYPAIVAPFLWLAKRKRIKKHTAKIPNAKQKVNEMVDSFGKEYVIPNKIRLSTVCQLYKDFRLSIF